MERSQSPSPDRRRAVVGAGSGSGVGVARPTPGSTGTGGGTGSGTGARTDGGTGGGTGNSAGSDAIVIDDVVSSLVEGVARPTEGQAGGREWSYRLWDYLGAEERRAFGPEGGETVAHIRVRVPRAYFELRLRSVMLQLMALEAVNVALESVGEPARDSLAIAARTARSKGVIGDREYNVLKRNLNAEGNASKHRRL